MKTVHPKRKLSRNSTSPRLSIVIPAYKSSRTIGICLLSVVITQPRNSEILVLLDGPGTQSKVLNYLERLRVVKVLRSKRNRGISYSMNRLVSLSKAPIVARMDADDICLPGRFRKGLRLVELGQADFIFGNSILFGYRLRPVFFIPQFPYSLNPRTSLLASALRNPFVNSTSVFRKAAFTRTGGCSESIAEDYELFLRAQVQGFKFIVLRSFLVMYRVHKDTHTGQPNFKLRVARDELLNRAIRSHREFVSEKFGLNPRSPLISGQIEELLIQGSLGFRIRTRLLDPLVTLVLRLLRI